MGVGRFGGGRQRGSLQHQLDGLAHRHEEAVGLGIGDRQGAAAGELAREQRDDRPGRAEHIAEPHGDIAGALAISRPAPRLVEVERLAEAFGEPLGGAHDTRRVDRFIGRDHDDECCTRGSRGFGDIATADDVGQHPLERVGLDHRQVLEGRRVKHDLRPLGGDDLLDLAALVHIAQ